MDFHGTSGAAAPFTGDSSFNLHQQYAYCAPWLPANQQLGGAKCKEVDNGEYDITRTADELTPNQWWNIRISVSGVGSVDVSRTARVF